MPATGSSETGFTIDETTHTIRFERDLACSPKEAFDAWTMPEHISRWWDPAGEPLESCEIDLKVGGAFTFVSRAHPEMPFVGLYRQIAPPDLLIFEAMGAVGRVLLEGRSAGTHMIVEITCRSQQQLNHFVQMGVATGTAQTLDNLVKHVDQDELVG